MLCVLLPIIPTPFYSQCDAEHDPSIKNSLVSQKDSQFICPQLTISVLEPSFTQRFSMKMMMKMIGGKLVC